MFYFHTVVGMVLQKVNVKYGGRTSLFLSSQRMPAATAVFSTFHN